MIDEDAATPVVVLPFLSARKLTDPFNKGIITYEFRVDTRNVPEIQTDANARSSEAAQNRRVYKVVRDAVLDGALKMDGENVTPGLFGYKHLGINIIAESVEERDDHVAVLNFKPGQGVVNGGHGLQIIRELQLDPKVGPDKMPPNFIKITVVTGLPVGVIPEIAGANNSSVQVKVQSLLELEGAFDPLKAALMGTRMDGQVQWREGDTAAVKVDDIVAAMTCFRSDAYPIGERQGSLINAYAYKTGLLAKYRTDQAGYHALAPRLPEILAFQDYIRTSPRETYNEQGGRFGALKFVDSIYTDAKGVKRAKPLPFFHMPFSGEDGVEYRLNVAAVYPILAAFRRFIKREGDVFEWTMPFDEMKAFWDSISVEIVEETRTQCINEGYNLTALGKSRPYWDAIERIVENATLRRELEAARAAIRAN